MGRSERSWFVAALALAIFHAASFDIASTPIVTDVRFFLTFAQWIGDGAVPHVDYFDPKTQLASFTGAAMIALGGIGGVDPLLSVRIGYVALAVAHAVALFWILRRLADDDGLAGVIGVAAWCAFPVLVLLPSIGNVPKMLMADAACLGAIAAARGRWVLAGAAGGIAFLDWQVGALVMGAAGVAAATSGERAARRCAKVALGAAAPLAAWAAYYAAHGALEVAVREVLVTPFARATDPAIETDVMHRLTKIRLHLARTSPGTGLLALLSLAGFVPLVRDGARDRASQRSILARVLAVYHLGVVGFSLVDYQGRGDLFLLAHTFAFGLGLVGVQALRAWEARRPADPGRRRTILAVAALVLLVARPGPLRHTRDDGRPSIRGIETPLAAQRAVASALVATVGDRRLALTASSELLFLGGLANAVPTIYWGDAPWVHFRRDASEGSVETLARLLAQADADVVVVEPGLEDALQLATTRQPVELESPDGSYSVRAWVRRPAPPPRHP